MLTIPADLCFSQYTGRLAMDILEPGALLAPHCQAGHAHGGNTAPDVSICDPQHEQYDSTHCRTSSGDAYMCAPQPK